MKTLNEALGRRLRIRRAGQAARDRRHPVASDRRSPDYLGRFVPSEVKKWEGPSGRAARRCSGRGHRQLKAGHELFSDPVQAFAAGFMNGTIARSSLNDSIFYFGELGMRKPARPA